MTVKIGAEGHLITNSPDLRGIKMRVADVQVRVEAGRARALEQLDPFSHGGWQPEPGPVTDDIIEISKRRDIPSIAVREIASAICAKCGWIGTGPACALVPVMTERRGIVARYQWYCPPWLAHPAAQETVSRGRCRWQQ